MGLSITWCAVREEYAQKLLDDLLLSPNGKSEEYPDSPISTAKLDTGWRIIWFNKYNSSIVGLKNIADISHERDVLLCLVEEHVMASSSELWSNGTRKWRISHEGVNGPKGLDATGDLPECFPAIKSEMEELQRADGGDDAEVDYIFEIPLKVAQSLVGFKHDEDCAHISNEQFEVLSRPSMRKGFFARLLGK